MIRYGSFHDNSIKPRKLFDRKLRKSLPRFLAYCTIMRACRAHPQFRRNRSVALGLVLHEGADMETFEQAARYAASGPAILHGGEDALAILTRTRKQGTGADSELMKALSSHRRVVLLAESALCIPDTFRMVADGVVEVERPLATHIMAGARLCLGLRITREQAEFLATAPTAILVSALRTGRSVRASVAAVKEAMRPNVRTEPGPTLDDLHGLGEAGEWGRELATDLADWKAGRIGWADVDRGILLSGPPGTGKTTFAGALARSCKVHLVVGSIARWQAKGHLGDLLKAMRAAFDEARRNAPSIIFLDEIDAVGDRERFDDRNAQYCTEVVAGLLECIDGADSREGVVVVGACNHPDRLDAALVRAGRLDRHVTVPLPDQKGREGILRWHLQGQLADRALTEVSSRTEGWTGASLEQLVRQARRLARRARRELTIDDLVSGLPTRMQLPERVRRRVAIHEAGHAVVGLTIDAGEIVSVSISESGLAKAGIQDGGGVIFRRQEFEERTRAEILNGIAVRLGGIAAEEILLGDRSAGAGGTEGSDLHEATLSALAFEATYGFGDGFAYLSSSEEVELFSSLRLDRFLQMRVDKVLAQQFSRAKDIVTSRRQEVERIAEALLVRGRFTGEELRDLVDQ
jgi:cell division protease FtsH